MKRYHVTYVVRPSLELEFGTTPKHLGWYRWRWLAEWRARHFNNYMRSGSRKSDMGFAWATVEDTRT